MFLKRENIKNLFQNDLSSMDIAYSVTTANILLNATLLEKYLSVIAPHNVTAFLEAFSSTAKQVHTKEQFSYILCFDKNPAKVSLFKKTLVCMFDQHASNSSFSLTFSQTSDFYT